jgi:hypothetical protein
MYVYSLGMTLYYAAEYALNKSKVHRVLFCQIFIIICTFVTYLASFLPLVWAHFVCGLLTQNWQHSLSVEC